MDGCMIPPMISCGLVLNIKYLESSVFMATPYIKENGILITVINNIQHVLIVAIKPVTQISNYQKLMGTTYMVQFILR